MEICGAGTPALLQATSAFPADIQSMYFNPLLGYRSRKSAGLRTALFPYHSIDILNWA
jgi:hypothetical protein